MKAIGENSFIANDFNDICSIIEELEQVIAPYAKQLVTQPTLWYRGQANSKWEVVPSIQRFNRISSEQVLCHSFYHGASQVNPTQIPRNSYDQWISLMQHYGLPTRLLDWSYSPLVALYFAVANYEQYADDDASITVLIPELLNISQGFDPFIYPIDSNSALQMLKPAFYNNSKKSDKILACFSISSDLRQYAQHAAFTIHDSKKSIREICDKNSLYTIIIPKSKKEYFSKTLYSLCIRDEFLFPDVSHVAKHVIHRHITINNK